jgi:hypothetical protein
MSCNIYLPNGNISECKYPLPEVRRVYLVDPDMTAFTGLADVYNLASWKSKIQTSLDIHVLQGKTSYEVTTDDPNIITTDETQKLITNRPAPSAIVYLDTNFCDYQELLRELRGGTYGVIYELKDHSIMMRRTSSGTYTSLPARIYAVGKGIPISGEIQNNFPLYINHIDFEDFENAVIIKPNWNPIELAEAMPIGLNMIITTAENAGDVVVLVTERCGDGYAGLTAPDFVVLSSSYLTTPAVTAAVDGGAGVYTLTIQKNTPAEDLAAGEYIEIQVKNTSSTVVTHISNRLTIVAN